jgi:putative tryptophan/tyrosine transport system substrate-binding protein
MRELGYVEGQNLTIDARWMEGNEPEEAARLTAELIRSKVDVLVAQGSAVPGVKAEAGSTPVVFGFSGDPVAARIVTSLARPGGNLTGMTLLAVELAAKRVELLKEAAPPISRGSRTPRIGARGATLEVEVAAVSRANGHRGQRRP